MVVEDGPTIQNYTKRTIHKTGESGETYDIEQCQLRAVEAGEADA